MKRVLIFCALIGLWSSQALAGVVEITSLTTNTTSSAVSVKNAVYKSVYGQVVCSSGACVQTQAIYGTILQTDTTNGILLCTLTLSGTPRAQDACPVITAPFPWFYVVTTSTSGTGATGTVQFFTQPTQ